MQRSSSTAPPASHGRRLPTSSTPPGTAPAPAASGHARAPTRSTRRANVTTKRQRRAPRAAGVRSRGIRTPPRCRSRVGALAPGRLRSVARSSRRRAGGIAGSGRLAVTGHAGALRTPPARSTRRRRQAALPGGRVAAQRGRRERPCARPGGIQGPDRHRERRLWERAVTVDQRACPAGAGRVAAAAPPAGSTSIARRDGIAPASSQRSITGQPPPVSRRFLRRHRRPHRGPFGCFPVVVG